MDFTKRRAAVSIAAQKLEALSPIKVLRRGYCVAHSGAEAVGSVNQISVGDSLSLSFWDGEVFATVMKKEKNENDR